MVRPSGPAEPRAPRRASVVLSRLGCLCTLAQPGGAVSASSCHVCAAPGLASPPLQSLGEVDRQHIPPLSVSRDVFSRDGDPVPQGEPGAACDAAEPEGCVTYTLQRTRLRVLASLGEPPAAPEDAEPGGDTFPLLPTVQCSIPAIDRSPMPAVATSWALYEGNDVGLC